MKQDIISFVAQFLSIVFMENYYLSILFELLFLFKLKDFKLIA